MIYISRKKLRITVSNRKRRIKKKGLYAVIVSITVLFLIIITIIVHGVLQKHQREERAEKMLPQLNIQENLLTVNEYSRPGIRLGTVRGIVVHYTANPGTDAVANRNYFNNLPTLNRKKENKTYASSHFVIGLEGEIIQCVPLDEIAYASNDRNSDTISIECCHRKKSGKFTKATYTSLVALTSYLCQKYNLSENEVIRHYDVTGKNCPKYFVEHEDAWQKFLVEVAVSMEEK